MTMRTESEQKAEPEPEGASFSRQVEAKAALKLRALRHPPRSVWLGLGVSGIIGWTVVVPTLAGALLGLFLERRYPGGRPWTVMLLAAGLCIGCFQAWNWVAREDKTMHEETEDVDD